MKKLLLLLGMVFCVLLCADEKTEVKNVLFKTYELAKQEKLTQLAELYSSDFVSISSSGQKITYQDIKTIVLIVDGKHPESFYVYSYKMKNNGRAPSSQQIKSAQAIIQSAEYRKQYQTLCLALKAILRKEAELEEKTIKIKNISVKGDTAVIIYDHKEINSEDETYQSTHDVFSVSTFKKINGSWKYISIITRKK